MGRLTKEQKQAYNSIKAHAVREGGGWKSRLNWRGGMCFRFDCVNKDIKCKECIRRDGKETCYSNKTN